MAASAGIQDSASSLEFNEKCGSGIVLSHNQRRAARSHPESEFDNGLVFSKAILVERTLFEVVIEKKMTLWSGSLAIGVTKCDPSAFDTVPASISHLRDGTWVLAGSSVLQDGLSIRDDYSANLEELKVSDRVGVMLLEGGKLHYFINGKDMGCAVKDIPSQVFVVIDVYGRCSEIKLYSGDMDDDTSSDIKTNDKDMFLTDNNTLHFHPQCGSHVKLTNNRKTVLRTNPNEDFNFGIALTSRTLALDELLEVEIEEVIDKWAGSLEIGVTTHAPGTFSLPGTMTNFTTGTWMFSGGAIVHNGVTILEAYGRNTASYKVGDKLGVCIQSDKTLHFYYNGMDLGPATSDLSTPFYGVVDIYGQAVKASIVKSDANKETLPPSNTVPTTQDLQIVAGGTDNQTAAERVLKFSESHGRLIVLNEGRTGASRLNALTEFNHAVVISEQPLEDDQLFEVVIEQITDRWSGSLEVGLLSLAPPDLELPITLTDLNHHCWVVSGASVMHDGTTIINGYGTDLDKLETGTKVGVMRKSDGTFHVFVNGEDKGTAASLVPPGVFATFDLYGQCVQVSIISEEIRSLCKTSSVESLIDESMLDLKYSFHSCCGENIAFRNHGHTAVRARSFNDGLVFTDKPLENEAVFEIRIDKLDEKWTGSLSIGVTSHVPPTQTPTQISELRNNTVFLSGSFVFRDDVKVRSCSVSLDRLQEGSRIGLQLQYDGSLHVFVDSKYKGVVANDIPQGVFGVVDVYGNTQSVSIVNTTNRILLDCYVSSDEETTANPNQIPESEIPDLSFHTKCGLNIIMDATCTTARRKSTFNEGLVFSRNPLANKEMFQVRVDSLNPSWSGSLAVGVLATHSLDKLNLPATALSLRSNFCVFVHGSQIHVNGNKIDSQYAYNFDDLREGDRVGVICDESNRLHIIVNDVDKGLIDHEIPPTKYAMLDLYGRCEQLFIVPCNKIPELKTGEESQEDAENDKVEEEDASLEESKDKMLSCPNCEYKTSCERFKMTLGIPEQYFEQNAICYCSTCCDTRGEHRVAVSGDPPQEYTRPTGWCKFELRLPPNLNSVEVFSKNHLAYTVVHVGSIRRTLDRGTVLPPQRSSHLISGHGDKKIVVSPSIVRATTLTNVKKFLFTDTTTGKRSSMQVAFEIRLPSQGYTKCTGTNSETELDARDWYLELPSRIVLSGLLVQISEEDR
ncbi:neuralized-like protein 4 [Dendronephthya gigantea]|uniref:neuralized-like protein 4 n=1 Tax=Dendronephthya gigantea TaxID=151771 RepID=UPI00106D57C3|nr:neuralized-like protein 4 [Dendronephthya gigantea]